MIKFNIIYVISTCLTLPGCEPAEASDAESIYESRKLLIRQIQGQIAKQVGSTAIDVGGKLAVEAGTAASAAATKAANDAIVANEGKIDPSIKKTAGEAGFALGKAAEVATPILAEGVREVTPFAQQAFGTITREGAKALKQALTEVEKEIDGYAAATPAASAPSGDVAAKIAQAEAERQALLSKIAELQ